MCPEAGLWMRGVHEENLEDRFFRVRCKQWSCPFCAKKNAAMLRGLIQKALKGYMETQGQAEAKLRYHIKLVTLTMPGKEYRSASSLEEREKLIKKNLDKLLKALRKKRGVNQWIWVKEAQRDGTPHIHLILIGAGIADKGLLKDVVKLWSDKYGMGNADVEVVMNAGGAAAYVAKYLTKGKGAGMKNHKVYGMSQELRKLVAGEKRKRQGWTIYQIGRINPDGSIGPVIWEKGEGIDKLKEKLEARELQNLLDFFEEKKFAKQGGLFDAEN